MTASTTYSHIFLSIQKRVFFPIRLENSIWSFLKWNWIGRIDHITKSSSHRHPCRFFLLVVCRVYSRCSSSSLTSSSAYHHLFRNQKAYIGFIIITTQLTKDWLATWLSCHPSIHTCFCSFRSSVFTTLFFSPFFAWLVQGLKLRKQRSTGDLDKRGTNSSIRSTGSTTSWMSSDSAQSAVTSGSHHTDSNASFVVEVSQVKSLKRTQNYNISQAY